MRKVHTLGFPREASGQCPAIVLTQDDHHEALAGAIGQSPPVDPLLLQVSRSDVASERGAIDLVLAARWASRVSAVMASRSLCMSTNAVLSCTSRSHEICTAGRPFEAFTERQIAPNRSANASLCEAKMVPEVALNWCWHAAHLKRRRAVSS
ncbi:hypothetical protein [Paracoccus sp. WLY502]|uniref:hypothetical protein n=1 Tax=Paracoccus yibinensis TaxID=3068891 RepID=UPI00358E8F4D